MMHRFSEPNQKVKKNFGALKYQYFTFIKKKIRNNQIENREWPIYWLPNNSFGIAANWIKILLFEILNKYRLCKSMQRSSGKFVVIDL